MGIILKSKIIPVEPFDLQSWRNWYAKLMIILVAIGIPLSMIVTLPLYIREKHYTLIALNTGIWLYALIRALINSRSYQVNVYIFFAILYIWMISLFITLGPVHARPAFLIMCTVLAAMLFGLRAAIVSAVANAAILMMLYALMGPENPSWAAEYAAPFSKWLVFVVNVTILSLAASVPVGFMLNKLDRSLKDERKALRELSAGNKKLRAAEEQYRGIFENAVEGIFQTTPEGSFITVNSAFATILGYKTPEECMTQIKDIGKQLYVKPGKREDLITALKENNTIKEFKAEVYRRDGSTVMISINARAVNNEDDQISHLEGFVQDVTNIMEAEKALKESEKKFRNLVENLTEGIYSLDPMGLITYINPAIEKILGYESSEILNRNFTDFIYEEDMAFIMERFKKILSDPGGDEYRVVNKNGEIRWLYSSTRPIFIEDKHLGFEGVLFDITESKRIEEALVQSEKKYRLLAENITDVIWTTDMNLDVTYVSPSAERGIGFTVEETLLRNAEKHLTPESLTVAKRILEEELETEKKANQNPFRSRTLELEFRHKKGSTRWSETQLSFIRDSNGKAIGIQGVSRDITERKMMEKEKKKLETQLIQTQKMEAIGSLAGGIAHDFNNILSAIIGYTELSQMDTPKGSSVSGYLDQILKAGNRAKDLVQQILTFSRQTEQELKPVSVKVIVKEALKLLRATLPTTIHISQHIESDSLVMGDPTQIHQILMNLCANAGHAMQEKGGILEVNLTSEDIDPVLASRHSDLKPGPYLNLTVNDTGHGMSPDVLSRIFDPFFTTKDRGEGTGMGLAVVHGIVKSYGGAVYVYSEPGKGSSFKVFLPAIEKGLKTDKRAEDVIPRGTERILFIDDEQALVDMGKQTLESLGYHVVTRTSSLEALNLFRSQPDRFDIVITDMTMPQMTGDKLARELISIREDIPVILCTGFSFGMTGKKAKEMGLKGFLEKPFGIRDIANKLRKILDE